MTGSFEKNVDFTGERLPVIESFDTGALLVIRRALITHTVLRKFTAVPSSPYIDSGYNLISVCAVILFNKYILSDSTTQSLRVFD